MQKVSDNKVRKVLGKISSFNIAKPVAMNVSTQGYQARPPVSYIFFHSYENILDTLGPRVSSTGGMVCSPQRGLPEVVAIQWWPC